MAERTLDERLQLLIDSFHPEYVDTEAVRMARIHIAAATAEVASLQSKLQDAANDLARHCACTHDERGDLNSECETHRLMREDRDMILTRLDEALKDAECWKEHAQKQRGERNTALIEKHVAESRLGRIKALVCGEKVPNWIDQNATTATRGLIADICDGAVERQLLDRATGAEAPARPAQNCTGDGHE